MKTENWEKTSEFMFGTSNVDELIRKQIAYTEEDYRKTSVLNALANSYESISYVDTETKEYIPYFATSDIKKWYNKKSLKEDLKEYILTQVLPEYQGPRQHKS